MLKEKHSKNSWLKKRKTGEKHCSEVKQKKQAKQKKRLDYERKTAKEQTKEGSDKEIKVKLPKLEIAKFNGIHLDWIRF